MVNERERIVFRELEVHVVKDIFNINGDDSSSPIRIAKLDRNNEYNWLVTRLEDPETGTRLISKIPSCAFKELVALRPDIFEERKIPIYAAPYNNERDK